MLKNLGGRPTKMTKETLDKLREAFLFGASDEEACAFAQISHTTLYTYQNEHEEFLEQKQQWKKDPILKAKMTVVKSLNDVKDAQWYLERKVKEEFSPRTEHTGADGEELRVKIIEDTELKDANSSTSD